MDPAVEFGVGIYLVVSNDGVFVEVVLHGEEEETVYDEEGAGLVVHLEQRAVHLDALVQEPLDELPEQAIYRVFKKSCRKRIANFSKNISATVFLSLLGAHQMWSI